MKKVFIFFFSIFLGMTSWGAQAPNSLDSIIVYKGETPGTGPGVSVLKLSVGEEVVLVAKGVDPEGKELLIAPTWKADKEISLIPIEGKGRCIKVRLKEAPTVAAYVTVVVIRDDGKKISTDVAVEAKKDSLSGPVMTYRHFLDVRSELNVFLLEPRLLFGQETVKIME